jgi:hypothetical protein
MSFKSKKCIGKKTGKPLTSYESEQEALDGIKYMKKKIKSLEPMCCYKCSTCGYYHLSPKSRQTESKLCGCVDSKGKYKQLYDTEKSAKRRASILKKENHVTLYVYPCPHSKGYHLTHTKPESSQSLFGKIFNRK